MKKVFVALANIKFIEHSKSLFHSAKMDGEWDGDFVLIVPIEDKGKFDEKEFTDKGIEIFFGKTLPGNPKPHYYKYYLWTEYFKKWDWIFYCDMDVLFFNKIDFDLKGKKKDTLYTNDCNGASLNHQFEYRDTEVEKFDNERKQKSKWIDDNYSKLPSFQSCFMLFNKDLIQDSTFSNLVKLHNEYYVYYDLVLHGLTEEQSILNVEFIGKWENLGDKFVNVYPRADELKWNLDKMNLSFKDNRDYKSEGVMALHFYQFFQPWSEHNLRFYPIWRQYRDEF